MPESRPAPQQPSAVRPAPAVPPPQAQPRVTGTAVVTHRPGAVRMDAYPLLTYGPRAEPRVRVASTGLPIEEVASLKGSGLSTDDLARRYGLTVEEVGQALRYLAEHPAR